MWVQKIPKVESADISTTPNVNYFMVKFWKIPYTFSVCLYNLQVTPFDSGIENFLNMIFRTIKKVTVKVKLPLRKLKTVLPSLKPPVEWSLSCDRPIIYQITCPSAL